MKQLVNFFTNKKGDKVLDVIFTDSYDLLQEPSILPPLQVDDDKTAKDSDHNGVQCVPRSNLAPKGGSLRKKISIRRFPESKIVEFGFTLVEEDWGSLEEDMDVDMMVECFEANSKKMVDRVFPENEIQVGPEEKPYFTEELRQLKRRRQRAYAHYGRRSQQYITLKQSFDFKLQHEAQKYVQKIRQEVSEGKRGSGYKAIRKLGNRPHDSWNQPQVNIQSYTELNLTPKEAADKIGDYFSAISQTVQPLDRSQFSPGLKLTLEQAKTGPKPVLSQHEVYRKILRVSKPNSEVPGDIPRQLLKRYPYLYAVPLTRIFNRMINTGNWPRRWVKEEAICLSKLEKSKTPANEDDLRTISKTAWASKLCENLLGDFILPVINSLLDPGQCGGLKKSSISHYLVKLLDFAHATLDKRTPHAAVLGTEDLSKAYNRGSHLLVLEDLHAMLHSSPHAGWILSLTCSYLTDRTMVLTHQQARSAEIKSAWRLLGWDRSWRSAVYSKV